MYGDIGTRREGILERAERLRRNFPNWAFNWKKETTTKKGTF